MTDFNHSSRKQPTMPHVSCLENNQGKNKMGKPLRRSQLAIFQDFLSILRDELWPWTFQTEAHFSSTEKKPGTLLQPNPPPAARTQIGSAWWFSGIVMPVCVTDSSQTPGLTLGQPTQPPGPKMQHFRHHIRPTSTPPQKSDSRPRKLSQISNRMVLTFDQMVQPGSRPVSLEASCHWNNTQRGLPGHWRWPWGVGLVRGQSWSSSGVEPSSHCCLLSWEGLGLLQLLWVLFQVNASPQAFSVTKSFLHLSEQCSSPFLFVILSLPPIVYQLFPESTNPQKCTSSNWSSNHSFSLHKSDSHSSDTSSKNHHPSNEMQQLHFSFSFWFVSEHQEILRNYEFWLF